MWQKLKEQLPAIILTAVLISGAAFWMHTRTIAQMAASQEAQLAPLREQNDSLKASAEENRRNIEATNKLLKDAISKREADMFRTDEELQKLNGERMDALASAIAKKVQPYNPLPKSPEEAEKMQNEQVDKVSSRMALKITPILSEMAKDQNLTRQAIEKYSQRISDQVGTAITGEMARNQSLNSSLRETQAVAGDAIKLNHELTALYLASFRDDGIVTRILMLPANVIKDAASFSIINSSDRAKVEQDLVSRENEVEKHLADIEAQSPKS
jgi:hypothetical protein